MSAQKGLSPLIIIVIVGLLIGVGGFFFFQKQNTKTPTQTAEKTSEKIVTEKEEPKSDEIYFESTEKKLLLSGGYADPSVINFNDKYIMYVNKFGNGPSANLAYTSSDGLTWTNTGKSVPGAPTSRAYVMDGKVRMYITTQVPINPSDPPSQLLSAISTDGLTFKAEPGIRLKPKSGHIIEGPSLIKTDSGFRMFFSEYEEKNPNERRNGMIYTATSKDGLTWSIEEKPVIESDHVEKSNDWKQTIRPFVLNRPSGGYIMFYNSHSKIFAALSEDGITWKKIGSLGIKGADVDGYYLSNGNIRIYFGDFSKETSGVVYTADLKEMKGKNPNTTDENQPMENVKPMGSKPPPPPECIGKTPNDPNLSQSCQMWFNIK